MIKDVFESAILPNKLARRFGADAWNAWYVVRCVSHEPLVVHDLRRLNTKACLNRGPIKVLKLAFPGRARKGDTNPVIHQLQGIEVAGGNHRAYVLLLRLS